jgi:hypothetical protein
MLHANHCVILAIFWGHKVLGSTQVPGRRGAGGADATGAAVLWPSQCDLSSYLAADRAYLDAMVKVLSTLAHT